MNASKPINMQRRSCAINLAFYCGSARLSLSSLQSICTRLVQRSRFFHGGSSSSKCYSDSTIDTSRLCILLRRSREQMQLPATIQCIYLAYMG